MPEAARQLDPITHSEALPEAKQSMWSGIGRGIWMGVKIVVAAAVVTVVVAAAAGAEVVTAGLGTPFVVGALLVIGGMAARYGAAGFVDGATHGQQTINVHGHIRTGSRNVTINKRPAAIACGSEVDCDQHANARIATGSNTVSINSKRASRKGDIGVCAFVISDGSSNVTIGGGRGQCAKIEGEISQGMMTAVKVAFWGGTAAALVGSLMMGGGKPSIGGSIVAGLRGLFTKPGIFIAGLSMEMGYFASQRSQQQGGSSVDQMEAGDNASLVTSLLGVSVIKGGPPTLRALDALATNNTGGLQPAFAVSGAGNLSSAGVLTGGPFEPFNPPTMMMADLNVPQREYNASTRSDDEILSDLDTAPRAGETEESAQARSQAAEQEVDRRTGGGVSDNQRGQAPQEHGEGEGAPQNAEADQPAPDQRRYVASPKHQVGGSGRPGQDITRMDLDDTTAQQVLQDGVPGANGRQVYGYRDGKLYVFQPDNASGYHGYPASETQDVPSSVIKQMRNNGTITTREYRDFNKLYGGKPE